MKKPRLYVYSTLVAGLLASCSIQESDKQANGSQDDGLSGIVYEAATTSDTVLVTEPMVEKHFVRLPDTPQGYRAQALLEVINADSAEQIMPFVFEHYAPDFVDQVPQSEHKALLRRLQEEIRYTEVESLESLENRYRISLRNQDGLKEYVLDITFEPQAPYKISGVRVL